MVPQENAVDAKEIAKSNISAKEYDGVFKKLMTEQPVDTMLAKQPIGPGANPAKPNKHVTHLLSQKPVAVRWL